MRSKIMRACSTALTITPSPGAVSTRSAAARAASVAPLTATPTSACLSAGASLTPSPVIPTICPRACSARTIWNLCSGKTRANPSACSASSPSSADGGRPSSTLASASSMVRGGDVGAEAELCGGLACDRDVVAGDHFDGDAVLAGVCDRLLGVRARRVEQRQQPEQRGLPILGAGDAEGAVALAGELLARCRAPVCAAAGRGRQSSSTTWGAPLIAVKDCPSGPWISASVRLRTGSNGVNALWV